MNTPTNIIATGYNAANGNDKITLTDNDYAFIINQWQRLINLKSMLIAAGRWNTTTKAGIDRRWNSLREKSKQAGLM